MVQVRQTFEYTQNGDIDLLRWQQQLPLPLDDADSQRVLAACEWVREASEFAGTDCIDWANDSNCLLAGLEIAQILADLHVGGGMFARWHSLSRGSRAKNNSG